MQRQAAYTEETNEETRLLPRQAESTIVPAGGQYVTITHGKSKVSFLRGFGISISLGALIFLQTSNISLLTTIQSPLADDLNAYANVSWFASAYLIAMSSITPLAGKLCQIFQPRSYVLGSSLLFTLGAVITSTAQTLPVFLLGRVLAGAGAAGNFPIGIIAIVSLTKIERRGLFMGMMNAGFTAGIAFGAVLAGLLEPAVGWRAIFWIQAPIAAVAGTCVFISLPIIQPPSDRIEENEQSLRTKLGSIDYLGVITLITSIVLVLFGLSSPHIQYVPIATGLAVVIFFIFVEARVAKSPIIPMTVLASRGTLFTCFATIAMMISRWLVLFYSPVYFIAVRGWSQASFGLVLLATNGGFAVGGLAVGFLHIKRAGSFWLACVVVFVIFALTVLCIALLSTADSAVWLYMLVAFVHGSATGASLNYTLVHLLHVTLPRTHFIATSVVAMFRGFAGSFGSAIGGGIFVRVLENVLTHKFHDVGGEDKTELITKLLGSPRLAASLQGKDRVVAMESYEVAIRTLFFAGAGLAVAATALQACTGRREPDTAPKEVSQTDDTSGE